MRPPRMLSQRFLWIGAVALLAALPAWSAEENYARVSHTEGQLIIQGRDETEPSYVELNAVLQAGDQLWTDESSRAEIELGSGSFLRLPEDSKLEIRRLGPQAEFRLWSGSVYVDLHANVRNPLQLLTPAGGVRIEPDSVVRIDLNSSDEARISVWRGRAKVDPDSGKDLTLSAGDRLVLAPGGEAGAVERFERLTTEDDFDTYQRERVQYYEARPPSEYLEQDLPGSRELDEAGDWLEYEGDRYWRPTDIDDDWRPYSDGYWSQVSGVRTWVSYAPWGYCTSHYGRWRYTGHHGWLWRPVHGYGPAWVHWGQYGDYYGWAPLDPYGHPAYYGGNGISIGYTHYYDRWSSFGISIWLGAWNFGHHSYFRGGYNRGHHHGFRHGYRHGYRDGFRDGRHTRRHRHGLGRFSSTHRGLRITRRQLFRHGDRHRPGRVADEFRSRGVRFDGPGTPDRRARVAKESFVRQDRKISARRGQLIERKFKVSRNQDGSFRRQTDPSTRTTDSRLIGPPAQILPRSGGFDRSRRQRQDPQVGNKKKAQGRPALPGGTKARQIGPPQQDGNSGTQRDRGFGRKRIRPGDSGGSGKSKITPVPPVRSGGKSRITPVPPVRSGGKSKITPVPPVRSGGKSRITPVPPVRSGGKSKITPVPPVRSGGKSKITPVPPSRGRDFNRNRGSGSSSSGKRKIDVTRDKLKGIPLGRPTVNTGSRNRGFSRDRASSTGKASVGGSSRSGVAPKPRVQGIPTRQGTRSGSKSGITQGRPRVKSSPGGSSRSGVAPKPRVQGIPTRQGTRSGSKSGITQGRPRVKSSPGGASRSGNRGFSRGSSGSSRSGAGAGTRGKSSSPRPTIQGIPTRSSGKSSSRSPRPSVQDFRRPSRSSGGSSKGYSSGSRSSGSRSSGSRSGGSRSSGSSRSYSSGSRSGGSRSSGSSKGYSSGSRSSGSRSSGSSRSYSSGSRSSGSRSSGSSKGYSSGSRSSGSRSSGSSRSYSSGSRSSGSRSSGSSRSYSGGSRSSSRSSSGGSRSSSGRSGGGGRRR